MNVISKIIFTVCLVLFSTGANKAFAQVTRPGTLIINKVGQDLQISITQAEPFWPIVLRRTDNLDAGSNTLWTTINTNQTDHAGSGLLYTDTNAVTLHPCRFYRAYAFGTGVPPNNSPEPSAVGVVRSAVAVPVASRRWLSFLR